jgi:hypothetical protein
VDRLSEYDIVTLNLPRTVRAVRLTDLDCTVVAVGRTAVTLQPVSPLPAPLPTRLEHVLLAFEHARGLVGLKGVLTSDDRGLRFVVEDGVQVQRRRCTRVDAAFGVVLRRHGKPDESAGTVKDIGVDGVLASAALEVDVGELLDVSLELPGSPELAETRGRVVRHGGGLIALEFDHPSSAVASSLENFVVAEQRRAMAGLPGASSSSQTTPRHGRPAGSIRSSPDAPPPKSS